MKPRTIRFSEKTDKAIEAAFQQRGFASSSAFIRYAVDQELTGRADDLTGAEDRLAGSIEAIRRELFRVMRVQQALFADEPGKLGDIPACNDAGSQKTAERVEFHFVLSGN